MYCALVPHCFLFSFYIFVAHIPSTAVLLSRSQLNPFFIFFLTKIFSLDEDYYHTQKYPPHSAPHQKNSPHSHKIVFWVRKSASGEKICVKRENFRKKNITDFGFSSDLDNIDKICFFFCGEWYYNFFSISKIHTSKSTRLKLSDCSKNKSSR